MFVHELTVINCKYVADLVTLGAVPPPPPKKKKKYLYIYIYDAVLEPTQYRSQSLEGCGGARATQKVGFTCPGRGELELLGPVLLVGKPYKSKKRPLGVLGGTHKRNNKKC